jgi:subtilisin family serine protease
VQAQGQQSDYYYRVYFKDKGSNPGRFTATDLLSQRSIQRREKSGIVSIDFRDVPVSGEYINIISSRGLRLHCTSKWMNTALFKSSASMNISSLLSLPFVKEVKLVKTPGIKGIRRKTEPEADQKSLTAYDRPIGMLNGYTLHYSGFKGDSILIAVLDGGFFNADVITSLNQLRARKGIISTYDFVLKKNTVYNSSSHGTAVLSILAGSIPDLISGSAPDADFILLKTEDVNSEFPCEEDFWAAGAEYADSAGADIISSSLGYYNFDDPTMDYKHQDLNGNTAFITNVADIAASKGILVVNSAGNERDNAWKKIIFPSDGDSVLAVGAVNENNIISEFSSAGPASDGRVKPDNVAMGVDVPIQTAAAYVSRGSGTSFSCPVLSGMAACLMQAVPQSTNMDIIEALQRSGDKWNSPDSLYGFGLPDMVKALELLQDKYIPVPDADAMIIPNPTTGTFELIFHDSQGSATIEIYNLNGKLIYRMSLPYHSGRTMSIEELQNQAQGVYFIRITTETGTIVKKIIKLRDNK